jgi:DNA repair exonuclease SbcCD ATPase subunit
MLIKIKTPHNSILTIDLKEFKKATIKGGSLKIFEGSSYITIQSTKIKELEKILDYILEKHSIFLDKIDKDKKEALKEKVKHNLELKKIETEIQNKEKFLSEMISLNENIIRESIQTTSLSALSLEIKELENTLYSFKDKIPDIEKDVLSLTAKIEEFKKVIF